MTLLNSPWTVRSALPGLAACCLLLGCFSALADDPADGYDPDAALTISQAAIGQPLQDLALTDSQGNPVSLAQYRGRPLLISLIFTSCYHVCPAITQHLNTIVKAGREALGEDSFQVLTIGFDTAVDTPEAMRQFARRQDVDDPNWAFLSGSAQTMEALVQNIGFVHFPSPRGFDHINQVTVVDGEGIIYRQVYGAAFELPALMEPLKQLVFNHPLKNEPLVSSLMNRIKLFCTVYDPATGRYRFDYSLFVGMAVGAAIVLALVLSLLLEYLRSRRSRKVRDDA
ncbi:MAG: SCO family protein [Xanthomonadales bacterium]|nr:SCO family protein [Xanthomonadales bacterium]